MQKTHVHEETSNDYSPTEIIDPNRYRNLFLKMNAASLACINSYYRETLTIWWQVKDIFKLFTVENQNNFFSISCINQEIWMPRIPDPLLIRVVVCYKKGRKERRYEKDNLKSTTSETFIGRRTAHFWGQHDEEVNFHLCILFNS